MVNRADVELAIRVKDLATQPFNQVAKAVEDLTAALGEQVEQARTGRISVGELRESFEKLRAAEQALLSQQGMIDRFNKQTAQLKEATEAAKANQAALDAHKAKLREGEAATKTWTAEQAKLTARAGKLDSTVATLNANLAKTVSSLRAVDIETDDLASSQARLVNTSLQVGQAKTVVKAAMDGYARNVRLAREEVKRLAAEERAAATATGPAGAAGAASAVTGRRMRGRGGETGLFGLRGFELQNLGYQINDVFTQLAGGTGIGQVIGQQGGQILQIFNRNLFDLISLIPRYSAVIAVATTATLAYLEAARRVASNREFRSELLATTSGLAYQAEQLTALRVKVREFGVSWADAGEAIKTAIGEGVSQDRIQQFIRLAQDISDRTGAKMPDTFKGLVEGFGAGYDAIVKLNEQYKFLTAAQAESIKAMFDSGRQAEASAQAFDLLRERQRAAAEEGLGPWGRAMREVLSLGRAVIAWLQDTGPIQAYIRYWVWLAEAIGGTARALRQLLFETGAESADRMETMLERTVRNRSDIIREARRRGQEPDTAEADATIRDLTAAIMAARARDRSASLPPTGNLFVNTEANRIGAQDYIAGLQRQLNAPRADDAGRIRAAGDEAVKAAQKEGIRLTAEQTAEIRRLAEAKERAEITDRRYLENLAAQRDALRDGANAARIAAAGIAARNAAVAAGVTSQEALNKAQEAGEQAERTRLSQAKTAGAQGESLFNQGISLRNQLAALERGGGNRAFLDLEERLGQIDDKFRALTDNIAKFRRAGGTMIGGEPVAAFEAAAATAADRAKQYETIRTKEEQLNQIIQERNALVQTYAALQQTGAITQTEATEKVAQAYAKTTPEIIKAKEELERLLDVALKMGALTPVQFDALRAKLQLFGAETRYVEPIVANLNRNIESAFSGSVTSGIQDVTKAMADFATGTAKAGDVFRAFGSAVLGILGNVASAIVSTIAQYYTMKALGGLGAGGPGGFLAGLLGIGAGAIGGAFSVPSTVSAGPGIAFNVLHGGGIVGAGGAPTRLLPAGLLANAPRYHGGAMVGLRPDEQAAVLQRGEEVLARDDPRNRANGGGGVAIRNVLVMEPGAIAGAMAGAAGERVILTAIKNNAPAIRQMVR